MNVRRERILFSFAPSWGLVRLCVVVFLLGSRSVLAQVEPPTPQPQTARVDEVAKIDAKIKEVEANASLDDTVKAAVLDLLNQARKQEEEAARQEALSAQYKREAEEAPRQLEQLQAEAANGEPAPAPPPVEASVQVLENLVAQSDARLIAQRDSLATLTKEPDTRAERKQSIPKTLAELDALEGEARGKLEQAPSAEASEEQRGANRMLLESTLRRVAAQRDALNKELAWIDARRDFLPRRIARETQRAQVMEQELQALRTALDEKRRAEASALEREAREAASKKAAELLPEEIRVLAKQNAEWAQQRNDPAGILARLREVQGARTTYERLLAEASDRRETLFERVRHSGQRAIGLMLRSELERLPDPADLQSIQKRFGPVYQDAQYDLVDFDERRDEFNDRRSSLDAQLRAAVDRTRDQDGAVASAAVDEVGKQVLGTHTVLLDSLIDEHYSLVGEIERLFVTVSELGDITEEVRGFIKERILWVKSVRGAFPVPSPVEAAEGGRWLVLGPEIEPGLVNLIETFRENPLPVLTWSLLALLMLPASAFASRVRLRATERVKKFSTDRFWYTPLATLCCFVIASRGALVIYALARIIVSGTTTPEVMTTWSRGLEAASIHVYFASCIIELLRKGGVVDSHYRWPSAAIQHVRVYLRAFLIPTAVFAGLTFAMVGQSNRAYEDSLGRFSFIALMVCCTALTWKLLSPSSPAVVEFIKRNRGGLAARTYWLWLVAFVGLPIVFLVLALIGYYYTALELSVRYAVTGWLLSGLVVLNATLLRWLFIERRRMAVARLQEKRAAAQTVESEQRITEAVSDESQLDLPAINAQTRQLIHSLMAVLIGVAVFAAWADVLPALRVLQRVEVYPQLRYVTSEHQQDAPATAFAQPTEEGAERAAENQGAIADADRQPSESAAEPRETRLTLFGLGLATLVGVLTWVAMSNLPGLLEITLLNRLPVDLGVKYAVTTVARYILLFIGIGIVAGNLGLEWSKLQWLVAALTVGLGFGLQEIVANFVSGIIILFERPVRVGDTITVGDYSGTVTRIRMRATTVLCWDQRELIIPNKSFITGDVINATLSNTRMRLIVPVGIAYGSDTGKAIEVLRRIVDRHPLVLREPAPMVLFTAFGESTLDFEVRVYMATSDDLLRLRHELHLQIDEAFREADIEIAFPQRDIHIRTVAAIPGLPTAAGEPKRG